MHPLSYIAMIILSVGCISQAANVKSVKGEKVLIDSPDAPIAVGEKYYLLDEAGKRKAVVEITQVKNEKAVANVIKGKPVVGMELRLVTEAAPADNNGLKRKKSAYGAMASYNMNTMNVSGSTAFSLTGTSFDLVGMYQTIVDGNIGVRAFAGYQTFSGVAPGRSIDLQYLGAGALVKYTFSRKTFEPWAGAGLNFLVPISKSASNSIDVSKTSTNQTVLISAGFDYKLKNNISFIPVQLNYTLFPSSSQITTNQIQIMVGYGKGF